MFVNGSKIEIIPFDESEGVGKLDFSLAINNMFKKKIVSLELRSTQLRPKLVLNLR